jgi:hypothetical protein
MGGEYGGRGQCDEVFFEINAILDWTRAESFARIRPAVFLFAYTIRSSQ